MAQSEGGGGIPESQMVIIRGLENERTSVVLEDMSGRKFEVTGRFNVTPEGVYLTSDQGAVYTVGYGYAIVDWS